MKMATGFIGIAEVGGITIMSGRRNTELDAAQALFLVLAGQSGDTDKATIAVDFLISNTDINAAMASETPAIPATTDNTPSTG